MRKIKTWLILLGFVSVAACGGGGGGADVSGNGDSGVTPTFVGAWTDSEGGGETFTFTADSVVYSGSIGEAQRQCSARGSMTVTGSNPWTTVWTINESTCPEVATGTSMTVQLEVSSDNQRLTMTPLSENAPEGVYTRLDGAGVETGDGDGATEEPAGAPVMATPYVNASDVVNIDPFSSSADTPLGREHDGIDFPVTGNLKPFQAVFSGEVFRVELWQNDRSSNWQVNVAIWFNSTYSTEYAFEPMTAVQADGQTQLDNILVSEGQTVSQGDVIGYLFTSGEGSHVHFGFYMNGEAVCPEPYFSQEARDSMMDVIHTDRPDWEMCY